jgi:hypothetical protein
MDSALLVLGREISMLTTVEILFFVALEISNSYEIRGHFLSLTQSNSKFDIKGGKWFPGSSGTHYIVCAQTEDGNMLRQQAVT